VSIQFNYFFDAFIVMEVGDLLLSPLCLVFFNNCTCFSIKLVFAGFVEVILEFQKVSLAAFFLQKQTKTLLSENFRVDKTKIFCVFANSVRILG